MTDHIVDANKLVRAEFEAWANDAGFNINRQDNDNYLYSATRGAWGAWQAATQRQQERIAALEAQVSTLTTALFDCREAFPIPEPGAPLEPAWMGAMVEPEGVPEYVKAQVQALRLDAGRYRYLRSHCLCAGHGSITVFLDDRHGTGNRARPLHLEEMDTAIDAAIAAGKGEG